MISAVIAVVVDFVANIINGVIVKWLEMRESRKRGAAEERNDAYEENARRKARADEIMAMPIKKGKALIDSIRNRSSSNTD
jgi:uncharacterized membrane protein (DUF106 family)